MAKAKGALRSLFSVEAAVLLVLVGGGVFFAGSYFGVWDGPDIADRDVEVTDQNETHLSIKVKSEHNSDAVILRHPDDEDYILAERGLEPFGGEYSIHANAVRCDDADFPDHTFEIALVTLEQDAGGGSLSGVEITTDASVTVELDEGFVNGECRN